MLFTRLYGNAIQISFVNHFTKQHFQIVFKSVPNFDLLAPIDASSGLIQVIVRHRMGYYMD